MQYKIAVDIEGPNSLYGKDGRHSVVCRAGSESVTFTFAPDTGLRKLSEFDIVKEGPIHEILFSF